MEHNDILTAQEVAAYLRMNTMTIYRMAQAGRIPASKVLDCWRFQRKAIDQWLNELCVINQILLVDSDREFITEAREVLCQSGAFCTTASTGQEALDYLQDKRFSWLFAGVNLDDGSGLLFLKQIIEDYPMQRAVLMVDPEEWGLIQGERDCLLTMEKIYHEDAWRQFAQAVGR